MNRPGIQALLFLTASVAWAQTPATDPTFFATKLYPVLEAAHCRICHTTSGVASGTRVHFPDADASQGQIEMFGLSLAPLVNRADVSHSLILQKPTQRIPHTGGERIKPGSDEEKVLTQWVQYLASNSDQSLAALRTKLSETAGSAM